MQRSVPAAILISVAEFLSKHTVDVISLQHAVNDKWRQGPTHSYRGQRVKESEVVPVHVMRANGEWGYSTTHS